MRECQICGLLFLGTDCPGCGSRMTNVLDAKGEGAQKLAQRGGLPGIGRLGESLGSILDESELIRFDESEANSSLPFGVGGGASKRITSLPFGIGSNPSIGYDATDTKLPSPEEITAESGSEMEVEMEVIVSADDEQGAVSDEGADVAAVAEVQSVQPQKITAVPLETTPPQTLKVVAARVEPDVEAVAEPTVMAVATPTSNVSVETVAVQATPVQATSVQATPVQAIVQATPVQAIVQATPVQAIVQATPVQATSVEVEAVAVAHSPGRTHAEPDMEQIYAEVETVVTHDFSDDLEPSEVLVNLDDLAEPVLDSMVFSPTEVTDLSEPELFPAQALELDADQGAEELALANKGFQAMANALWDEAAVCFQQLAKKHPTDARIMNNYGLALLQRAISMQDDDHFSLIDGADTQFEAAIMALRQAAHSDPGEVTVLFNLGNALAGSGRYDKALRIFNAFLERSPPTSGALNGRAAAFIGLGRFDEATRDLNDAVSRFGDHPVLLSNLRRLAPA
jgi:hypothetical protein